jgi:phosphoribosylaminoimidazole-succinocarboxamide synthase
MHKDSSRFWPADQYAVGEQQSSFDKQFVRDWLSANPLFDKKTGMMLPDDVIEKTMEKYEAIRKLLVNYKI